MDYGIGEYAGAISGDNKSRIKQSDFCICDFVAAEYAEEIRGYAAGARQRILIDVEHKTAL